MPAVRNGDFGRRDAGATGSGRGGNGGNVPRVGPRGVGMCGKSCGGGEDRRDRQECLSHAANYANPGDERLGIFQIAERKMPAAGLTAFRICDQAGRAANQACRLGALRNVFESIFPGEIIQ